MDNQTLLTIREVAVIFKVKERTIRDWRRTGRFPGATRPPGTRAWRIPYRDVHVLIATGVSATDSLGKDSKGGS